LKASPEWPVNSRIMATNLETYSICALVRSE
jgi:hypothetical protein